MSSLHSNFLKYKVSKIDRAYDFLWHKIQWNCIGVFLNGSLFSVFYRNSFGVLLGQPEQDIDSTDGCKDWFGLILNAIFFKQQTSLMPSSYTLCRKRSFVEDKDMHKVLAGASRDVYTFVGICKNPKHFTYRFSYYGQEMMKAECWGSRAVRKTWQASLVI